MAEERKPPRLRGDDVSAQGFQLPGEFNLRLQRYIQAQTGHDPSQQGGPVALSLYDPATRPVVLLEDLSLPPWRKNGRAFSAPARAPANPATFNTFFFKNISLENRLDVLVLDELRVGGGATDFRMGLAIVSGVTTVLGRELESQQQDVSEVAGSRTAKTPRPSSLRFAFSNAATIFSDGVEADLFGDDAYGGAGAYTKVALGVVLWPGVSLVVQQLTVNLALNCTVKGRIINLGQPTASY